MTDTATNPKVVHFFDCADVGKTLVKYGREAGYQWRYRPWNPVSMRPKEQRPAFPTLVTAEWRIRRTVEAVRGDLMHIHFGTRTGVANSRPHLPFVMHWHGTDIRTHYYNPSIKPTIQWGADHAAHVVYATPDLREHALSARSDATYFPIPIDFSELPQWEPAGRPRLVFSSRWDESKGGREQLALLRALKARLDEGVVFEGLDWGDRATDARALGVRLVPKMPKARFLQWMAGAHCVVGQTSGILATSELEAIAMGAPTVISVKPGYYPGSPFLAGADRDAIAERVREVLLDPFAAVASAEASSWVRRHHGPEILIPQLAAVYRAAVRR